MYEGKFGYSSELPEEIRDIFMWLCQDVASLRNTWTFYLELFSTEKDTRLLSELAQASFQMVEESLRNDMTMAICRLSDPAASLGHQNLSMTALAERCTGFLDIRDSLDDFLNACQPVRQLRNKRIGHNDLSTRIEPHDNPLPGIGRSTIETVIRLAERLLNLVYQHFVDAELSFHPIQIGGADDLLYWLRMAKEYHEERERAERGAVG